ncbi:hypothetical protein AB0F43_31245 [Kribbella sp. NPDC023972]|uniref:hypothetical protein n=1 Tax=Kribbella sp. NPDC023972 TaxID=3154795 RepID=UPI0033E37DEF
MDSETKTSLASVRPAPDAWPTLVIGVALAALLNLLAVLGSAETVPRWHIAGAVILPASILFGALGWRLPWPARFLRTSCSAALALLLVANIITFYPRAQAAIAAIGYPTVLSYAVAAVGWLVTLSGLGLMWPGGPVRPGLFKLRW